MTPGGEQAILQRLNDLHEGMAEVKELVKETNGRVRALEIWRATLAGMHLTIKAVPTVVSIVASTVSVTAVLVALHVF